MANIGQEVSLDLVSGRLGHLEKKLGSVGDLWREIELVLLHFEVRSQLESIAVGLQLHGLVPRDDGV